MHIYIYIYIYVYIYRVNPEKGVEGGKLLGSTLASSDNGEPCRVSNHTQSFIYTLQDTRGGGRVDWPLQDIVITNSVWCVAHKRDVGRGAVYCPIIVQ